MKRGSDDTDKVSKDCSYTTMWNVFRDSQDEDIDRLTECIIDYINFCVGNTVHTRTVQCFSNNKPWINPDFMRENERGFKSGKQGQAEN